MKGFTMSDEVESVETAPEDTPDLAVDSSEESAKPKKKGKARLILLVIVIVLVLLFGGGGVVYATQHPNPLFCNAVCHTPMDPYVMSYMEGTSVNPLQTDLQYPLLVTVHRDSDQEVICLDCHTDGLGVQISEGISWLTGNVPQPLNPLVMTIREPNAPHQRSGITTCLVAGCHEGISSLDDLKASTADLKRNVHDNHNGAQNCSLCHQMHEQPTVFCTQCHADAPLPDGWLTYAEQQKQIKQLAALQEQEG